MIRLVVCGKSQRMVPQPPSFTGAKKNGKFTAGCVVSIDGWCLLSTGAQQWSRHGSDLQIISGSYLDRHLRRARLAHDAGGRRVLKAAGCLRRSRAPSKKREACSGGDEASSSGYCRLFIVHKLGVSTQDRGLSKKCCRACTSLPIRL